MKNIFWIFTLIVLMVLVIYPTAVFAITVSPPVSDLNARPGDSVVGVVKLYNETNETSTLVAVMQSFGALGESGVPAFATAAQSTDLATWIKLDQTTVALAPGARKDIPFTINVPKDAKPGGYYAGILWSGTTSGSGGNIGVTAETGTLVLLRVAGDVSEAGRVISFTADKNFYDYLPINFSVRFEDDGDVHLKPVGVIEIRNCLGSKVASVPVNENLGNILPNSVRKFDAVWQKSESTQGVSEWQKERENFAWGKYTANLILNYGSDGREATASFVFWVFPWRVSIFYLALLIIAIFLIIFGVRSYNRWLVKKVNRK